MLASRCARGIASSGPRQASSHTTCGCRYSRRRTCDAARWRPRARMPGPVRLSCIDALGIGLRSEPDSPIGSWAGSAKAPGFACREGGPASSAVKAECIPRIATRASAARNRGIGEVPKVEALKAQLQELHSSACMFCAQRRACGLHVRTPHAGEPPWHAGLGRRIRVWTLNVTYASWRPTPGRTIPDCGLGPVVARGLTAAHLRRDTPDTVPTGLHNCRGSQSRSGW